MKKLAFTLFAIIVLVSCNTNHDSNIQDSDLVGDWKLIEVLTDPGDGSGLFFTVESDKTLSFLNDGTISSNGDLCNMSASIGNASSGTYSELESTITPETCQESIPNWNYLFVMDGNSLIINYPCIEPCRAKYLKQ